MHGGISSESLRDGESIETVSISSFRVGFFLYCGFWAVGRLSLYVCVDYDGCDVDFMYEMLTVQRALDFWFRYVVGIFPSVQAEDCRSVLFVVNDSVDCLLFSATLDSQHEVRVSFVENMGDWFDKQVRSPSEPLRYAITQ